LRAWAEEQTKWYSLTKMPLPIIATPIDILLVLQLRDMVVLKGSALFVKGGVIAG
jgi:hypothetical protein